MAVSIRPARIACWKTPGCRNWATVAFQTEGMVGHSHTCTEHMLSLLHRSEFVTALERMPCMHALCYGTFTVDFTVKGA